MPTRDTWRQTRPNRHDHLASDYSVLPGGNEKRWLLMRAGRIIGRYPSRGAAMDEAELLLAAAEAVRGVLTSAQAARVTA